MDAAGRGVAAGLRRMSFNNKRLTACSEEPSSCGNADHRLQKALPAQTH
jgi:hypothetical protein